MRCRLPARLRSRRRASRPTQRSPRPSKGRCTPWARIQTTSPGGRPQRCSSSPTRILDFIGPTCPRNGCVAASSFPPTKPRPNSSAGTSRPRTAGSLSSVELARKVRRHEAGIRQALTLKLNNAQIEATNNKIKLIIRKAYGFREVKNLIDMVMLVCSNLRIPLGHREGSDGKKRSGHLKRYFLRATHNYA